MISGNRADWTFTTADDGTITGTRGKETDTFKNVESFQFNDGTYAADELTPKSDHLSVSDVKEGKATVSIGDRYTVDLDEKTASWTITDKHDGSSTRVWGDPHVDVGNDGKTDFDFKKDATFTLEDGTKITADTTYKDGDKVSWTTGLTITKGDESVVVTGLAGKVDGEHNLAVQDSNSGGKALDGQTDDGAFTAVESGKGWTIDGKAADQHVVNAKEAAAH